MSNATTTRKPLRFSTTNIAESWLLETRNYGMIHHTGADYIVVQFADGAVWAFTAADETVQIPGW